MLEMPRDEQMRGYIQNKLAMLQRRRRRLKWAGLAAAVGDLIAVTVGTWSVTHALAFGFLAAVLTIATQALCDLHIDQLAALKRDLDRDLALGLEGFETAD